jgi:hypothetical protein
MDLSWWHFVRYLYSGHLLCTETDWKETVWSDGFSLNESYYLEDLSFSRRWLWRVLFSGIERRIIHWKSANVSGKHLTSVLKEEEWAMQEIDTKQTASYVRLILRPWKWRRHVSPKRQSPFNGLHGVISQNMGLSESYLCQVYSQERQWRFSYTIYMLWLRWRP